MCRASVSPKQAASLNFSSMMSVDVVPEISVVRSFRVANTICGGGGDGRGAGDILNWSPLKAFLKKHLRTAH